MSSASFQKFWNHPAGPKTIHFWAPLFKWGLVAAGISDLSRPASSLSLSQSASLTLTGFIWARYSTQIIPLNWSLLAVNFFLGCTGVTQVARILHYRYKVLPNESSSSPGQFK